MDRERTAYLQEVVREGFLDFVTIKNYNEAVNCKNIWGKKISNRGNKHLFIIYSFTHSFNIEHGSWARQSSRPQGDCDKQDEFLQKHVSLKCK